MKNRTYYIIVVVLFLVAFVVTFNYGGCGKRGGSSSGSSSTPPATSAPSVTTNPATDITQTTATLNGTVNPNGVTISVYFRYGPSITYGSATAYQNISSGTSPISVTATITGLSLNTRYNFRIFGTGNFGTINGDNLTFTTVTGVPGTVATVTCSGPDQITSGVQSSSFTAVSKDINNNTVSDTYTWTKADGTGTANLTGAQLTGILAGTVTITATSVANPIVSGSKTVTVVPGAVATVTCSGPDQITSGVQSSSFTAISKDINNNIVSDTYIWSKADGAGTANLSGDKLTGILIGTVTITATSNSAPTKSGGKTVTVVPGAVATVTISGVNSITSAGTAETYNAVSKDTAGNNVSETYTWYHTDDTGSITRTTNTITGFLAGAVTITATGNSAVAGNKVVLVTPNVINDYLVIPASYYAITGTNQTATVTARDVNGNTVTYDSSTVITMTITAVTGTPTVTLYTNNQYITPTITSTLTSGIATIYYRAVNDGTPPNGFTLTAIDNNNEGTSQTVTIPIYGAPATLVFTVQPTNTTAGATITPAVTVTCYDQYNNLIPNVSVYMVVLSGSPTLYGTSPQTTDTNGTATFNNLSIRVTGAGYRLRASLTP